MQGHTSGRHLCSAGALSAARECCTSGAAAQPAGGGPPPPSPEGAHGAVDAVRQHERDGAVQAKGRVVQVLKHVQVVQAVRLCRGWE